MKKGLKIVGCILAVLLIVAGFFWFYCRVINHRSFMAGLTDLVLTVQHRSDKFTDLDVCEAFIEEKAVENLEPISIDSAKFGISIREERALPLQAFIYNEQTAPKQTVFYFHGGAYINQPNNQQTTMAARTAKETGAEVVLMVYPKEPVYTCEEAYEICIEWYLSYIETKDCGKIVFMGDSAGGGLALGLAMELRDRGVTCPEELVLISPWVDLTMSNPAMPEAVKKDAMLGIDGLRHMGEVWAGDLDMKDPKVSPIYGDLTGLAPITLTTGTWEVLYPDTQLLYEKMTEAGADVTYLIGETMMHCYPICPVPEAKEAQELIWKAIGR